MAMSLVLLDGLYEGCTSMDLAPTSWKGSGSLVLPSSHSPALIRTSLTGTLRVEREREWEDKQAGLFVPCHLHLPLHTASRGQHELVTNDGTTAEQRLGRLTQHHCLPWDLSEVGIDILHSSGLGAVRERDDEQRLLAALQDSLYFARTYRLLRVAQTPARLTGQGST